MLAPVNRVTLILALLLGAWLRFAGLARPSFWLDEILNYDIATRALARPWWESLTGFATDGPLSYAFALAGRFVSSPELSARLAPALFGVAAIFVGWLAARRLAPEVSLVYPLLLAVAPLHVYYSREARPYALLILLATAMTALLLRGGSMGVAIVVLVAAIYASPGSTPLLLATAIAAGAAYVIGRNPFHGRYATAAVLAAALVPLLYGAWPAKASDVPATLSARYLPSLIASFSFAAVDTSDVSRAAYLVLAFAVIGAIALARDDRAKAAIVGGMALLPVLLGLLALWRLKHWYAVRYVAVALPAYLLLAAIGIAAIARLVRHRVARPAITLVLAAAFLREALPAARREPLRKLDWRVVAQTLWDHAGPSDAVLATNEWARVSLEFYLRRLPPRVRLYGARDMLPIAASIVDQNDPVWIVSAGTDASDVSAWTCRYPVVLANPLESLRVHYAPTLAHFVEHRMTAADARNAARGQLFVDFGPADEVLLRGQWANAEGEQRWVQGTRAAVVLPMGYAADHRIVVSLLPHGEQRARVSLNGAPVADFALDQGWKEYEIATRAGQWRPGGNVLAFEFSRASVASPIDARTISAMFDNLWVVPPGKTVDRQPWKPAVSMVSIGGQSLAEQLAWNSVCLDDKGFLALAYRELYGRPIDPKGERYHLGRMRRGQTREDVVRTMMRSPEFRPRR